MMMRNYRDYKRESICRLRLCPSTFSFTLVKLRWRKR